MLILEHVSQTMKLIPNILTVGKFLGKLVLEGTCRSLSHSSFLPQSMLW